MLMNLIQRLLNIAKLSSRGVWSGSIPLLDVAVPCQNGIVIIIPSEINIHATVN